MASLERTNQDDLKIKLAIVKEHSGELNPQSFILDFGCGAGRDVHDFRALGYQAFGCDIDFKSEDCIDTVEMQVSNVLRLIERQPYRLPFEDNTFDLILSDQVLEHVQNYPEMVAEIHRVVKPSGCCLHIFPSRYKLIEPHVFVPFASFFRPYWWLRLWATFGIRNEFQSGLSASETAVNNWNYLKNQTNYLPRKMIIESFSKHFGEIVFCEATMLKKSARTGLKKAVENAFSAMPDLYSGIGSRVLLTKHPTKLEGT